MRFDIALVGATVIYELRGWPTTIFELGIFTSVELLFDSLNVDFYFITC